MLCSHCGLAEAACSELNVGLSFIVLMRWKEVPKLLLACIANSRRLSWSGATSVLVVGSLYEVSAAC